MLGTVAWVLEFESSLVENHLVEQKFSELGESPTAVAIEHGLLQMLLSLSTYEMHISGTGAQLSASFWWFRVVWMLTET